MNDKFGLIKHMTTIYRSNVCLEIVEYKNTAVQTNYMIKMYIIVFCMTVQFRGPSEDMTKTPEALNELDRFYLVRI